MSQSEYYERAAGVTLAYESGEREDDALERLEWVVPIAFLGAAALMSVAAVEWLAPMVPILLFVGLIWVPLSLVVLRAGHGEADPGGIAAAMAVVMAFGLPLMAWNIDSYRAGMLVVVDRMAPVEISMDAVDDPSDSIARSACARKLESADLSEILELAGRLEARPGVAVDCLDAAGPDQWDTAARVAAEIVDNWYDGWMTRGSVGEDLACRQARWAGWLARMYGADARAELLTCRFEAPDDVVAACCGRGATEFARETGTMDAQPRRWLRQMHLPLFESLTEVLDVPTATLESDSPVDETLAWTYADLWDWTMRLGCHLLAVEEHDVEGIARHLAEATRRHCEIDPGDPMVSFAALRTVDQTCRACMDLDRIGLDDWCGAARKARRSTAVTMARFAVYRARRAFAVEELVELVNRGVEFVARADERGPVATREQLARPEIDRAFETPDQGRPDPRWTRMDEDQHEDFREMTRRYYEDRQRVRDELEQGDEGGDDDARAVDVDRAIGDEVRQDLSEFRDDFEEMDESAP